MDKTSRAPKQLGDFGEGLVTYALIRKGFEVACVDHVGADLIAERDERRIAVSVKTRLFREGSKESRMAVFEYSHIEKLEHFAKRFALEPVLAHVACIADEKIIYLFILRVSDMKEHLDQVKFGYSFRFSAKQLNNTIDLPYVDYSSWSQELIGSTLELWPPNAE